MNRSYNAEYYQRHKAAIKARVAAYRQAHPEQCKALVRKWQLANPDKKKAGNALWYAQNKVQAMASHREVSRKRRHVDVNFRLIGNLRSRLNVAIKKSARSGSCVRDLGCTIPELRTYLESQFKPGMTWDNWSRTGWHIDHKKPLSGFDLTDRSQFLEAVHYTNLQPLWAEENLKKGAGVS